MFKPKHVPVLSRLLLLKASKVAGVWFRSGLAYLIELASKPNDRIHCTRLRNLFNLPGRGSEELVTAYANEDEDNRFFSLGDPELPIEAIDKTTLNTVKARLNKLIQMEVEAYNWNDDARLEDIRDERDKLFEYMKDTVSSHGKIKQLNSQAHADYRAVYKSINRTLVKLWEIDPELAEEIQNNLETGIFFVYKEAV